MTPTYPEIRVSLYLIQILGALCDSHLHRVGRPHDPVCHSRSGLHQEPPAVQRWSSFHCHYLPSGQSHTAQRGGGTSSDTKEAKEHEIIGGDEEKISIMLLVSETSTKQLRALKVKSNRLSTLIEKTVFTEIRAHSIKLDTKGLTFTQKLLCCLSLCVGQTETNHKRSTRAPTLFLK